MFSMNSVISERAKPSGVTSFASEDARDPAEDVLDGLDEAVQERFMLQVVVIPNNLGAGSRAVSWLCARRGWSTCEDTGGKEGVR